MLYSRFVSSIHSIFIDHSLAFVMTCLYKKLASSLTDKTMNLYSKTTTGTWLRKYYYASCPIATFQIILSKSTAGSFVCSNFANEIVFNVVA